MKLEIPLRPRKILNLLIGASLILSLLNLFVIFFKFFLHNDLRGLVELFNVDGDSNIPTWYASITLLISSLLLMFISQLKVLRKDKYTKKWRILAILFLLLSIDEVARIHERSAGLAALIVTTDLNGFLHFRWVVFGIIFVFVVAIYYLDFLRHLPIKIRRLFLLSAIVFIIGALGIEMINAKLDYLGTEPLLYVLSTGLEELFEMLGVATFIFALLTYIKNYMGVEAFKIYVLYNPAFPLDKFDDQAHNETIKQKLNQSY